MPLPSLTPPLAKLFKRLTYGSVLSGHSIHVYRQAGSMLTSVENFWPGLVGGQTFPWMAVADVLPIWTESRLVGQDWLEMKAPLGNTHLPNVVQQDNFALIVYKPFKPMPLALFGDVALYWPPESDFDEVRSLESDGKDDRLLTVVAGAFWNWMNGSSSGQNGSWLLGRKGDSYVAIFRPCGEKKEKGWYACSGVSGRQVWASIVGDSIRYGSFEAFAEAVQVSTVTEVYRWRWLGKPVYETSLTVDGKTIRHHW